MRLPGRHKKTPLQINGAKTVLLAEQIASLHDPKTKADLYVTVSGRKVVFGLVQAEVGESIKAGKPHNPKNVYLECHGSRSARVSEEDFGIAGDLKGSVYVHKKHRSTTPGINLKKEFTALLRGLFHTTTLEQRGFDSHTASAIRNSLIGTGVIAPGITRTRN